MKQILFQWLLISYLTMGCSTCPEQIPVTYYLKFRLVNTKRDDWYSSHKQYQPDSLTRLISGYGGTLIGVKCPVERNENGNFIFDCDVTFGSAGSTERMYLFKLNDTDVDTLSLQMTKKSSGNGRCQTMYTNSVTIFYNGTQITQVDSDKNTSQWQELQARQFITSLIKRN